MAIVLSSGLVLSEIEELAADNPLIGWHDLVETTNIDATSEDPEFPVVNLANPATHLPWVGGAANTGDYYVTVTTNFADEIDYAGVAKHNFGSAGIAVSLEGCADMGASPQVWFELIAEFIPADDSPILFVYENQVLNGVRLRMQQGSAPPEAAVLYVGTLLRMERSIKIDVPHTPFPLGIVSKEVNGKSESGNFLGRIEINRFNESEAEFSHITPAWFREEFQPFLVERPPFFFAWNPTEYPTEVGFAWLVSNPIPEVDTVTRRVAVKLKMQGVV
jgi:hypothetical protein